MKLWLPPMLLPEAFPGVSPPQAQRGRGWALPMDEGSGGLPTAGTATRMVPAHTSCQEGLSRGGGGIIFNYTPPPPPPAPSFALVPTTGRALRVSASSPGPAATDRGDASARHPPARRHAGAFPAGDTWWWWGGVSLGPSGRAGGRGVTTAGTRFLFPFSAADGECPGARALGDVSVVGDIRALGPTPPSPATPPPFSC